MWRDFLARPRVKARGAVLLGGVALTATGAGLALALSDDDRPCTMIGGMTGVTVQLTRADLRDTKRTTVCVEARCTTLRPRASGVQVEVRASGPRLVPVMVVLERDGAPADVRAANTRLRRSEPNGPGCGTWWNAEVTSDALPPVPTRRAGQIIGPPEK